MLLFRGQTSRSPKQQSKYSNNSHFMLLQMTSIKGLTTEVDNGCSLCILLSPVCWVHEKTTLSPSKKWNETASTRVELSVSESNTLSSYQLKQICSCKKRYNLDWGHCDFITVKGTKCCIESYHEIKTTN